MDTSLDPLLDKAGLKKTNLRRRLLSAFLTADGSLSQADLLKIMAHAGEAADRVSLYRNLAQLKASGLIHEVEPNTYVHCRHRCSKHSHLLLFCQNCQRHVEVHNHNQTTQVLESLRSLHFFGTETPLSIRGVCQTCAKNK